MILNGVIHTMEGKTIDSGYIRVENGKIQQVGRMDQLPDGAELEKTGRTSMRPPRCVPPTSGCWTGSTPWTPM